MHLLWPAGEVSRAAQAAAQHQLPVRVAAQAAQRHARALRASGARTPPPAHQSALHVADEWRQDARRRAPHAPLPAHAPQERRIRHAVREHCAGEGGAHAAVRRAAALPRRGVRGRQGHAAAAQAQPARQDHALHMHHREGALARQLAHRDRSTSRRDRHARRRRAAHDRRRLARRHLRDDPLQGQVLLQGRLVCL